MNFLPTSIYLLVEYLFVRPRMKKRAKKTIIILPILDPMDIGIFFSISSS